MYIILLYKYKERGSEKMFGITDDYFNLLLDIVAQNDLAMRIDAEGILIFRDGEEPYMEDNNLGRLIGRLLYTDTDLDVDVVLDIRQLELLDRELFEQLYMRYAEVTLEKFKVWQHPKLTEAIRILENFKSVVGADYVVYNHHFFNDIQYDNQIFIPEKLFIHNVLHDNKVYAQECHADTLKGVELLRYLMQRKVVAYAEEHQDKSDLHYALLNGFTYESIMGDLVVLEDEENCYSLRQLVEGTLESMMYELKRQMIHIVSEEGFIEFCEKNTTFFDLTGRILEGKEVADYLGMDVVVNW